MAIQVINIGSSANKGDGDPLRTAFKKINENFAELNTTTTNTVRDMQGSVFGDDSTLLVDAVNSLIPSSVLSGNLPAIDGSALTGLVTTETDPIVGAITGIVKADGSGNISAAVAGTDYLTTVAFADITSKPTTVAGYGITDALTSVPAQTFASLTGKPTTIAGYGITDALALGTSSTTALAGDTALFSGAFADLTSKPTTISGYGITDAFDGNYGSLSSTPTLFDGVFASLTSKPTTISGYGITDALALGTSSTTALAGDTSIPDGTFASLTSKPSTIAGYGITDAYTKTEVDNLTTTLDGDLTGSVFGDDSTLLVDGNNNKIVGAVDTTSLRTSETGIALGSGAGQSSGFYSVAIGYDAGQTTQGAQSIAIGEAAGKTTQSDLAVAIGTHAGYTTQGVNAIAIGGKAGETNQAANSIVINATGVAVNNIVADTFVVKPVREVAGGTLPTGFKTVGYNPTTGEFIYLAGV